MYIHQKKQIDPGDTPVDVYDFRKATADVVAKYIGLLKQTDDEEIKAAIREHIEFILRQDRE